MKFNQTIAFLLGLVFLAGCGRNIVTECEPQEQKPILERTTFSSIQRDVFTPSCAISGCHAGKNAPYGLDLSADVAYANLVNVASGEQPGMLRVAPGKSSESFLIKKLLGQNTSRMPPAPAPPLDASVIDSIRAWIDRGAPQD